MVLVIKGKNTEIMVKLAALVSVFGNAKIRDLAAVRSLPGRSARGHKPSRSRLLKGGESCDYQN